MRYVSAISTCPDPYRAGTEIGETLKTISPEVVVMFSAVSYGPNLSDLFAGLSDALDDPELIVFGGTGDGVYETTQAANYAVSALGIDSEGGMRWSTAVESGTKQDSRGAAKRCAERALLDLGSEASFCMVMADGATADGTGIVLGVRDVVAVPVFGGLAGDDRKFSKSRVFLGGEEYEDAVVVLLGQGSMPYAINAASGWEPLGQPGTIEDADGTVIHRVSGQNARDFITAQIGKPLGEIDIGVAPLAAYQNGTDHPYFLRTPSRIDANGDIHTFGSVPVGTLVRVCTATREAVLQGVTEAVEGLLSSRLGFEPKAALVVSCAARKWLLEDCGDRELKALFGGLGKRLPLAGFPSFGEIGPLTTPVGYTESYFHNVTFVLCLLGG